jgi:hypothetical protein
MCVPVRPSVRPSVCPVNFVRTSPTKVLGGFQPKLVNIISTQGSCAPVIYYFIRSFVTELSPFFQMNKPCPDNSSQSSGPILTIFGTHHRYPRQLCTCNLFYGPTLFDIVIPPLLVCHLFSTCHLFSFFVPCGVED